MRFASYFANKRLAALVYKRRQRPPARGASHQAGLPLSVLSPSAALRLLPSRAASRGSGPPWKTIPCRGVRISFSKAMPAIRRISSDCSGPNATLSLRRMTILPRCCCKVCSSARSMSRGRSESSASMIRVRGTPSATRIWRASRGWVPGWRGELRRGGLLLRRGRGRRLGW